MQSAVENIRQSLGGTYTYDALDGVRQQGLSPKVARPDVARIAIVMTDGESYYPDKTAAAAKRLKDEGVVVFAVGIGDQVNNNELESIASEPKESYLFQVGSYELLDEIKVELAMNACEGESLKSFSVNPVSEFHFMNIAKNVLWFFIDPIVQRL